MSGRHLVTGGAGYLGSALVARLQRDEVPLRVFDLQPAPAGSRFDWHVGDIRNRSALRRALEDVEVVHHAVALVPLARSSAALWSVNVEGTEALLAAAREAGVRKVVFVSSSAVYGAPHRMPVDETTPLLPQEPYGRAKLAAEAACRQAARDGLAVDIVRPRTILGAGRLGIMQILFEWILHGRGVPVLGRGDNRYQFVHADDVVEVCLRAAARPGAGLYLAGTDRFGTMRQALENLIRHAGSRSHVVRVPMRPAQLAMRATSAVGLSPLGAYHALMYGRSMWFDLTRTQATLGWTPQWDQDALFADAYDWYVAHRDEVLRTEGGSLHRSAVNQGILELVSRVW